MRRTKRKYSPPNTINRSSQSVDRGLFLLTILLSGIGILAVADASAPQALTYFKDSFFYVKQQLQWGILGTVLLIINTRIHYSYWKKVSVYIFWANIILLVLVLLPGLGTKALGARRWLNFGFFSFQPSEVMKLTLTIYMAHLVEIGKPLKVFLTTLGIVGALVMLQPDLGTTIILISIGFIQLFAAGVPILSLAGVGLGGMIFGLLLILSSDYRRQRLLTYLSSTDQSSSSSYHIKQVLIALGSGGLFGVGLGQSRQKYLFLPESATDSVFAIISEEVGFVGSVIMIGLLMVFLSRCIRVAKNSPDRFSSILAVGVTAWIASQIFLNIGSMVALTPLTGVPLPFFSYGGTSLTAILFSVGILLNISRYAKTRN